MFKKLLACFLLLFLCVGCDNATKPKLGISFGVGPAKRWPVEMNLMVERAKELGMDVDARLNKTDTPKTQTEDCIDMIDNGISTLILVPRDANKTNEILDYARKRTSRSCYMREPYSAKTSTSSSVTTHTRSDRALARTFPKKPIKVPLPY